MRADRFKQVMQEIDSSFDEKNVGKAKFSLFVAEAAKRGLVSLNKLENGQLEVDLPKAAPLAADATAAPVQAAVTAPPSADAEEDRGRRSKHHFQKSHCNILMVPCLQDYYSESDRFDGVDR